MTQREGHIIRELKRLRPLMMETEYAARQSEVAMDIGWKVAVLESNLACLRSGVTAKFIVVHLAGGKLHMVIRRKTLEPVKVARRDVQLGRGETALSFCEWLDTEAATSALVPTRIYGAIGLLHPVCIDGMREDRRQGLIYGPYTVRLADGTCIWPKDAEENSLLTWRCAHCGEAN